MCSLDVWFSALDRVPGCVSSAALLSFLLKCLIGDMNPLVTGHQQGDVLLEERTGYAQRLCLAATFFFRWMLSCV